MDTRTLWAEQPVKLLIFKNTHRSAHLYFGDDMEKEERIRNFQDWLDDGNELTVEDILAIVISCMYNEKVDDYTTFLMLCGKIYDINIKARKIS